MDKIADLKQKGNESLKKGNFAEAIFHYTHAIKVDKNNAQLYSNRSLAFLKMQHYYLAYEDANETIKLLPNWAKGHFRKAEVEFQAGHYAKALESYRKALHLEPENQQLLKAIYTTKVELRKREQRDARIPWVGAAFGFLCGIMASLGIHHTWPSTLMANPLFLLAIIFTCATIAFFLGRVYRYYLKDHERSLLEPPLELFPEEKDK